MLKITLVVQDKKDGNCSVKIEMPKSLEKATENEKSVGSAVYQKLTETLQTLEQNAQN